MSLSECHTATGHAGDRAFSEESGGELGSQISDIFGRASAGSEALFSLACQVSMSSMR